LLYVCLYVYVVIQPLAAKPNKSINQYGFLLVINTNLPPILHRFQVMADCCDQSFANEKGVPHFNALAGGDPLPISS